MSEHTLGFDIPPDVRLHMMEGTPYNEVVDNLPNRSKEDIEFGLLVMSRLVAFEELSKLMTIGALKYGTSKEILGRVDARPESAEAEALVDPAKLPFLKECHALCVEFHVRAVRDYKAKQANGNN